MDAGLVVVASPDCVLLLTENMQMNQSISPLAPDGRIAFVQAGWHQDIVEQCRLTFIQHLAGYNIGPQQISIVDVPGSLEIPLQCRCLPGRVTSS